MDLRLVTVWAFTKDLISELINDRVGLIAAGIAFYGLLSIFPAIAAMMALGGLLTEPASLVGEIQHLGSVLPAEASKIITDQATEIAGSQSGGLGLAVIVGLLISIYSASKAVGALITGIHVAAGEVDDRTIFGSIFFTMAMTVVVVLLALLALLATIIVPAISAALGLTGWIASILSLLRWPILGVVTACGLGLLYRLSLRHRTPPAPWVTPGAIVAVVLWLIGSIAFSFYVRDFADYNKTFGTLGGVVSLLMWMWLSAFIVLLGEEVNAIIAKQDKPDTDPLMPPVSVPGPVPDLA